MSGSDDLFHYLSGTAIEWLAEHGTCEGEALAREQLRAFLPSTLDGYYEAGGDWVDEDVVNRTVRNVASFRAHAGHGPFYSRARGTKRGTLVLRIGRGMRPKPLPHPHLTKEARFEARVAAMRAVEDFEAAGIAGSGPGGRPSIRQIVERECVLGRNVKPGAVRFCRDGICCGGGPRLKVQLMRLPDAARRMAEFLLWLPEGRVHVVRLDDLAARIWQPSSNASTVRGHRKRVADMLELIDAEIGGLNVRIVAKLAIVGRRRSIPDDPVAFARTATIRTIERSDRQGAARSEEAGLAEELLDYVRIFEQESCRRRVAERFAVAGEDAETVADYRYEEAIEVMSRAETLQACADFADCPPDSGLFERSGYPSASAADHLLAPALGALPREWIPEPFVMCGTPKAALYAQHDDAFVALHRQYAQVRGDIADLYRWLYEWRGRRIRGAARIVHRTLTRWRGYDRQDDPPPRWQQYLWLTNMLRDVGRRRRRGRPRVHPDTKRVVNEAPLRGMVRPASRRAQIVAFVPAPKVRPKAGPIAPAEAEEPVNLRSRYPELSDEDWALIPSFLRGS